MTGVANRNKNSSVIGQRGLHWRKRGSVYKHDPRHVDVLVKDFGLEQGNSVQTSATHDVTERRAGADGPSSTQQI